MKYICCLCSTNPPRTFSSKSSLSFHENNIHLNNKIIPHSRCLTSPSLYDICQFKNSFIMQLKARLQFHRSEPRAKTLKMEPFSEGLFIILFYNKSTFQYSPAQRNIFANLRVLKVMNNWEFFLVIKTGVVKGDVQEHAHMY
ncbi:unnamed protein product [Rhizophagus irregularis]|nr:unnamed protein product [Rhizophagus irregularis]